MNPHRKLWQAAVFCVAANALASVAMLAVIRLGSPLVDVTERISFLRAHAGLWVAAWATWPIAAVSLVCFYARLRLVLAPEDRVVSAVAVLIAAAGMVPDITAEVFYMYVFPKIAGRPTGVPGITLEEGDRICAFLTGFLGNGAYTIAWGMLALLGARSAGFPRGLVWGALPGIVAGVGLCVAAALNHGMGMAATTAVLMPTFLLWCAAVGWWARGRAAPAMPSTS